MSPTGATPHGWSRRTRHVVVRVVVLVGAYAAWGALAWLMVSVDTYSSTAISSGTGRPTTVTQSSSTLYQVQPTMVRALLAGAAVAVVIATGSVVWRVVRRSERLGVTGIIVAGLVGAVGLLGMLTIGIVVMPLAALLVVLALPIAPEPKAGPTPPAVVPPGWYGDAGPSSTWRYWDGHSWTGHTASVGTPP